VCFPAGKEVHFWDQYYDRGIAWYSALFPNGDTRKKGEITPAYAMLPIATIRGIYALNPDLRILYVIRNPIERAWSAALMALERAELKLTEASDQWFIDHFRSSGSLSRGDYEACLRKWRSTFDHDQLLVLRYEQVCESPKSVLRRCSAHIGVDPDIYDQADKESLQARVFAGPDYKIRPSLLSTLLDIYRPRIEQLENYLGEDLTAWSSIQNWD